jgi:adenylate cyclase
MDWTDALIDWLLHEGTVSDDPVRLAHDLGARLTAAGLPLYRLQLSMPFLDPQHRASSVTWYADGRLIAENNAHGEPQEQAFRRSPIQHLLDKGINEGRWDLRDGPSIEDFPLLVRLSEDGATDYVLRLVSFPNETFLLGMAASIATTAPEGFTPRHVEALERILPALGLAVYRMALTRLSGDVLRLYVGPRTSARILGGEIQRGKGEALYAAILLADLKNFTGLNEQHPPADIVRWLNESFEVIGAAVQREKGEILKLMGDSVLAIFPVDRDIGDVSRACKQALAAAEAAIAETAALNAARRARGEPEIAVDLVLHLGEVFYGNVGAARRLDFTVIGRVVNEAARLEALCDPLERSLLLSQSFAGRCDRPTIPLGSFKLKGVHDPHTVYGLATP